LFVGAVVVGLWHHWVFPLLFEYSFDAQGRHSSKTVTIAMMSAAQEQKKLDAGYPESPK